MIAHSSRKPDGTLGATVWLSLSYLFFFLFVLLSSREEDLPLMIFGLSLFAGGCFLLGVVLFFFLSPGCEGVSFYPVGDGSMVDIGFVC